VHSQTTGTYSTSSATTGFSYITSAFSSGCDPNQRLNCEDNISTNEGPCSKTNNNSTNSYCGCPLAVISCFQQSRCDYGSSYDDAVAGCQQLTCCPPPGTFSGSCGRDLIALIVVGGIEFIVIIAGGIVILRKRRRTQFTKGGKEMEDDKVALREGVTSFMAESTPAPPSAPPLSA